jgi:hypothetical protein
MVVQNLFQHSPFAAREQRTRMSPGLWSAKLGCGGAVIAGLPSDESPKQHGWQTVESGTPSAMRVSLSLLSLSILDEDVVG